MNFVLNIWRQGMNDAPGQLTTYKVSDIGPDMSFLEMLDALNEELIESGDDPEAFEHRRHRRNADVCVRSHFTRRRADIVRPELLAQPHRDRGACDGLAYPQGSQAVGEIGEPPGG